MAAVRIEYDQPITTGTYGLSDYFVNGYDVRAVYVSDTGVYQEAARTGNYVIVEFAISQVPGYYEGKMNFWTTDNSYIDPPWTSTAPAMTAGSPPPAASTSRRTTTSPAL